jgi:ATP-dependent DNA ligase
LSPLPAKQAYLDGELCGVTRDVKTSFGLIQTASDSGNADALVFFLFDLLYLDGEVISSAPVTQRRERLRDLLSTIATPLQYTVSMGDLLNVLLHLFREAPSRSREASTASSKDRAPSQHSGRVGSTR